MLTFVDSLLNRITMYRLVLYTLIAWLAIAAIFGAFGMLPYNPIAIIFSSLVLVIVAWATNGIFAKTFKAPANAESSYITALILASIITPVTPNNMAGLAFLIWAAIWAMASKYILAISRKHIFNPAAFGVALTAFTIGQSASWWICGNLPMLIPILVGGLLITRKIQRFDLVLIFLGAAAASIVFMNGSPDALTTLQKAISHTPILFFAFIMLTEPLTTPPTRPLRIAYAALVGFIFAPQVHIGNIYSTPELALLVGNIFAYMVSPKKKYLFALHEKKEMGTDTYDFRFEKKEPIGFKPGQYMEWTLAHKNPDGRGNRRYFTIASSPTEKDIHLGIRFRDHKSSFKKAMLTMQPGNTMLGGQLAGDFTLPNDPKKKLVFIAGGIGITPFRSMVKYLSDRKEERDIILLYSNRTPDEISYREVFDEAEKKIKLKTIYAITDKNQPSQIPKAHQGRIDEELIKREIPDFKERTFYISGTHAMTTAFKKTLREIGIPPTQIKVDFFPGFV